jgi:ElaA protein
MVQGKWIAPGQPFDAALRLREAVFVQEQGFSKELERDAKDDISWHVLLYLDGVPAATGRIYYEDGAYWMGRICVQKDARGHGLGDLLMRMLLDKAKRHFAPRVCLGAQVRVAPFYARYGFAPCGKPYDEEGVPHQTMCIRGEDIRLEHACGGDCAEASACQDAHHRHDPEA